MADNESKMDERDKAKVSASEPYEVSYFAEKHRPSRTDTDAAAERAKG